MWTKKTHFGIGMVNCVSAKAFLFFGIIWTTDSCKLRFLDRALNILFSEP